MVKDPACNVAFGVAPVMCFRLQGYVVWCPSHLQPGDPLSRMQPDIHGHLARAEVASQCRLGELLRSLHKCRFVGGVVL